MGFSKLKLMPYLHFYLNSIDATEHEVHVLYWNRDLQEENRVPDVHFHEFCCYQEDYVPAVSKIGSFLKYRRFAASVLRSENFDLVVALHTMPAVLLADVLRKVKFIFDYRDVTYESIPAFRKLIHKIVCDSVATFVSSDGFRKYLPQEQSGKIYTSHNLLLDSLNHRDSELIPSDKLRISFWGNIRNESTEKLIISRLAGDPRFELHYYGRDNHISARLAEYAGELSGSNVFFHGEYKPEDRYRFARQTDVIHNVYGYAASKDAMTNKYYDSIIFRIPQLCLPGSFMASEAERSGTGIALDPADGDFADKLYTYCQNLPTDTFRACCDKELDRILAEYYAGTEMLKRMFTD